MSSSLREVRESLDFILGRKILGSGEIILEPDYITQNKNALIHLSLLLAKRMPRHAGMTLEELHFLDDAPNNIREATKLLSIGNAHQITISADGKKGDRLEQREIVLRSLRAILRDVIDRKKPVAIGFDWGEVLETCFDTEDFENYDAIGSDVQRVLTDLKWRGCVFIDVSNDLDFARHSQLLQTHAGFPLDAAATGALVPLYRTFMLCEALRNAVNPTKVIELRDFVIQAVNDIVSQKALPSYFNIPNRYNTNIFQLMLGTRFPSLSESAKHLAVQLFYAIGNCRYVAETSYQLMLPAFIEGRVPSSRDNNVYKDTSINTLGIPDNFEEIVQQYGREYSMHIQGGARVSEADVAVEHPSHGDAAAQEDPERALKDRMIAKLRAYTDRIEAHKQAGLIDFTFGFSFFKDSQAINRQANYQLAILLITQLANTDESALPVSAILQDIEQSRANMRDWVLKRTPEKNKHWWSRDWGNQSSQLSAILKDLQTISAVGEDTPRPMPGFGS